MLGNVFEVSIWESKFPSVCWLLYEGSSYVVLCLFRVKGGMYLVEPVLDFVVCRKKSMVVRILSREDLDIMLRSNRSVQFLLVQYIDSRESGVQICDISVQVYYHV